MELVATKPILKKILKGILHSEKEDKGKHENMGKNKSQ
jgi:hypothetical protein